MENILRMYTKDNHLVLIQDPKSKTQKSKALLETISSKIYALSETPQNLGKDDLFTCIRPLLCFGRFIGIVPLSGLFKSQKGGPTSNLVYFRKGSGASVTSAILIFILLLNEIVALLSFLNAPARDAADIVNNSGALMCYSIGLYVYIFMYRNSYKLIICLEKWRQLKTTFYFEDNHLFRNVLLISAVIYTSAILENVVSHWQYFKGLLAPGKDKKFSSVWESYFMQSHGPYLNVVPNHWGIAIGVFLCNKLAVYAWNFGDILIAVLSRGIYKRFELLTEDFKTRVKRGTQDQKLWLKAVEDHENLVDAFTHFKRLLSPLIFACTATNIYFICLTLNSFLVPSDEDAVNYVQEAWAFIHLLFRTFTAILLCARVNTHAHRIDNVLAKCPVSILPKEVERTELKLRTTSISFDGLNCFNITNSFALSVFGVICNFEIVLLQFSSQSQATAATRR